MKSLPLLLVACVAYVIAEATDDLSDAESIKSFNDCLELYYGQAEERIESISASENSCILNLCFLMHYGVINEDKSLNVDALLKARKSHVPEARIHDAVEKCSSKSHDNLQESCKALSCFQELLPESDFNYPEDKR